MIASAVAAGVVAAVTFANPAMGPSEEPPAKTTFRGPNDSINWNQQRIGSLPRGIDISRWDHLDGRAPDFNLIKTRRVSFVFIKASDSIPRADTEAKGWWDIDAPLARQAGLMVGGYQYSVPREGVPIVEDAKAQAAKMIANMSGGLPSGYLPPVLDLEMAPSSIRPPQLTKWAVTWLREVEAATGRRPIIYTYTNFMRTRFRPTANLRQFPLWQAEYGKGMTSPKQVAGFQRPHFWQFTSNGLIPGSGADRTDLNAFMRKPQVLFNLARIPLDERSKYAL